MTSKLSLVFAAVAACLFYSSVVFGKAAVFDVEQQPNIAAEFRKMLQTGLKSNVPNACGCDLTIDNQFEISQIQGSCAAQRSACGAICTSELENGDVFYSVNNTCPSSGTGGSCFGNLPEIFPGSQPGFCNEGVCNVTYSIPFLGTFSIASTPCNATVINF